MPTERMEAFANRVRNLKEWGKDYEILYGILHSLFEKKGYHIRGVVDLHAFEMRQNSIEDLTVDIAQKSPASGSIPELYISLSVSLGKDNLRKIYEKVLPPPHEIGIPLLEEINKDEVLQQVVKNLNSETARKSFMPF